MLEEAPTLHGSSGFFDVRVVCGITQVDGRNDQRSFTCWSWMTSLATTVVRG